MIYRLAKETDIDKICSLIENAVIEMESHQIFQRKGRFYLMENIYNPFVKTVIATITTE